MPCDFPATARLAPARPGQQFDLEAAYNTVGYREETRARLAARRRGRQIPVLEPPVGVPEVFALAIDSPDRP